MSEINCSNCLSVILPFEPSEILCLVSLTDRKMDLYI